uniref:Uncharacterized protein n=1 Tax=Nelumbo nucifera TaxID=4432 RepID=A0A822ZBK4_NELNU|nr:TPA_asm: hypothetical protein HUJ06_016246 [Nelumbo nucifera]
MHMDAIWISRSCTFLSIRIQSLLHFELKKEILVGNRHIPNPVQQSNFF